MIRWFPLSHYAPSIAKAVHREGLAFVAADAGLA
jgi:hypothetical protein